LISILKTIRDNPYLSAIVCTAFIVRFIGVFHDLPYSYFPDELHFISRAAGFGSGDLNPHWFHKPAFFMYLLFFEYGLYFVIGKIIGIFGSLNDFIVYFFQSKGPFLLMGRLTVALFGTGTVLVTYLIGRDSFNRRTGLLAALFLSLVAGHVVSSQVIKADVPTTFFTMLSFYFIARIYDSGRMKDYVLAGVFAGLGMATKYYSIALVPTILLAHIFYLRKSHLPIMQNLINKSSLAIVPVFFITFFIASPYNVIDPLGFEQTFVNPLLNVLDVGGESSEEFLRAIGVDVQTLIYLRSIRYYFTVLISPDSMGKIGIVAILGLIVLLIRMSPRNLIILSFPVLFILIANKTNPFYSESRHMNPIYPFMALFAAYFIDALSARFQNKRTAGWTVAALSVFTLALPAYQVVAHDYVMTRPDTRTMATEWVEASIPAGSRILIDENSVNISPDRNYFETLRARAMKMEESQFTTHADTYYRYSAEALPEITYDLTYIRFPWWQEKEEKSGVYNADSDNDKDMGNPLKPVGVLEYDQYIKKGYKIAVLQSDNYNRFLTNTDASIRFPSFRRFYKTLFEKAILIKEFNPEEHNMRGPTVKVFKIN